MTFRDVLGAGGDRGVPWHEHDAADISGIFQQVITPGNVVYADVGDTSNVDIASTTYVTVKTTDVLNVEAGDTLQAELHGIFFNNSAAVRTYTIDGDFGAAFASEATVLVGDHATQGSVFGIRWTLTVVSTSSSYYTGWHLSHGEPDQPGGTWAAATSSAAWDSASSDLTGTVTVRLQIKSSSGFATQGFRVVSFDVRKFASIG